MKGKKIYIVIELVKNEAPKIIDVFEKKSEAEKCASIPGAAWRNAIEKVIK
jgi:hypothetical protein